MGITLGAFILYVLAFFIPYFTFVWVLTTIYEKNHIRRHNYIGVDVHKKDILENQQVNRRIVK